MQVLMVNGLRESSQLFITLSRFYSSLGVCQLASCPFSPPPDSVIMSSEPDPDIMLLSK